MLILLDILIILFFNDFSVYQKQRNNNFIYNIYYLYENFYFLKQHCWYVIIRNDIFIYLINNDLFAKIILFLYYNGKHE